MLARCEFGIIGRARGNGRAGSAVAASAYNLCARLEDGSRAYDFSRKRAEHVGGCVMLPPGAPPELREPGALWRTAETAERRSDAQLARQLLITVPREVQPQDRLAFAQAVVAPYVADGAGAQVDLHCPAAADGGEQPHAHILLTLRRVTDAGLAASKCREWNQAFREDNGRAERARVAARVTAWLHAHGLEIAYDLRSLAERGEDRPPEPTAPRADWQKWHREGADPKAAPATVAATIAHRGRRAALARAEHAAADAAAEVVALSHRLAVAAEPRPEADFRPTGATARPPEGAYTPESRPAAISTHPVRKEKGAPGRPTGPDHYTACRDAWRAEQASRRPDPRAALRAHHRQERDRVYLETQPGAGRTVLLARLERRQCSERVTARAEALAASWSAPAQRETLDAWVARQAAAGHPAAHGLTVARERAAAARARRDPISEAARRVAVWQAEATAALAAAPSGPADIRALAAAASARAHAKEKSARKAAAAARRAAREHARRAGWLGGLIVIGRAAVVEHRRLVAAVVAADRRVQYAAAERREEKEAVQRAASAAERKCKDTRHAWATGAGATVGDRLAALGVIQRAVRAGDSDSLVAVMAGDEHGAGRAAEVWQSAPQQVRAPARTGKPAQADARAAVLMMLARSEANVARDPHRLAAARTATAAAVAGDEATIAAAVNGDTAGAERAAAEWQARQRADLAKRERPRLAKIALHVTEQPGYAGPGG